MSHVRVRLLFSAQVKVRYPSHYINWIYLTGAGRQTVQFWAIWPAMGKYLNKMKWQVWFCNITQSLIFSKHGRLQRTSILTLHLHFDISAIHQYCRDAPLNDFKVISSVIFWAFITVIRNKEISEKEKSDFCREYFHVSIAVYVVVFQLMSSKNVPEFKKYLVTWSTKNITNGNIYSKTPTITRLRIHSDISLFKSRGELKVTVTQPVLFPNSWSELLPTIREFNIPTSPEDFYTYVSEAILIPHFLTN
jgi:hypothetical protein